MRTRSLHRGAALVISLMMLVLITIIVVATMHSMRLERSAANTNLEKTVAEQLAGLAIDKVRANLQQQTADPSRNWISQPGGLVVPPIGGTNQQVSTVVDLHSGEATATSSTVFAPAMLNQRLFRDPGSHLITDNLNISPFADGLPLKWIYIRKDGTEDPGITPNTANKINPIIGRYAYWTDDESSKVNFNLAWTRSAANTTSIGNQSRVNLTALPGFTEEMANSLHGFVSKDNFQSINKRFFNSPEDARQLETEAPGISEILKKNRFDLTYYNHDPDTTFFNEPRIVLTTRKDKAGGRVFLDIAKVDNTDLAKGDATVIDETKLNKVIDLLVSYLKRTDWPMAPGSSFQSKYYQGNENRLTQLAINIIDYVRAKESTEKFIIPLRGEKPPGSKFSLGLANSSNAFLGPGRGPRITEMGVWVSPTKEGAVYKGKLIFEIFLPENFGIEEINLTDKMRVLYSIVLPGNKFENGSPEPLITSSMVTGIPDAKHLKKGEYAVITLPFDITGFATRDAITDAKLKVAITYNYGRLDLIPLVGSSSSYPTVPIDPPAVAEADISSTEVDDPRVNAHKDNWFPSTGSGTKKNTFGAKNSISTIGQDPIAGLSPEQDTDTAGKISAASLYIPPPKGSAGNLTGLVTSPAELGFIHTGVESSSKAGIPWRTMRLQPNKETDTSVVPDWAFMDLFAAPTDVAPAGEKLFSPYSTATGGRVNLNTAVKPFGVERILPLTAVFLDAQRSTLSSAKVSREEAQEIANNIQNRVLATNGKQYGYQDGFDSPGEIVEIKGVADGGEESEELVRQVGNLLTTRGNVFSAYAIGQTLKQSENGTLTVTAEQRQQAVIERYVVILNDKGTLDPTDDTREVRLKTIFFRNLSL